MGSIKKKIGIAVSAVGLCIVAATFVSVVSANSTDKVEIRLLITRQQVQKLQILLQSFLSL